MPYTGAVAQFFSGVARVVFGYLLFDGSLVTFAWSISSATLVDARVLVYQQTRSVAFGSHALLGTVAPSVAVALACVSAGMVLHLLIPVSLAPLLRLVAALSPLRLVWYMSPRVARHELLSEVHCLAAAAWMRALRLMRPARA